ncbi:hypothetical protein NC796_17830 [Aliifodinibius sp. S!AR15-10]|uniref:hypothetical protein n=1 Tax=Aliifodinibius sp. S!AR15-10 TaxID=2950437 RepID=UPI0028676261|nr:hypothetical protein [Aliifodinibius sp. S!AR15-10]MDR8393021.1 hypothetical protein [Aliifodinibius sp. S!AR15-10]
MVLAEVEETQQKFHQAVIFWVTFFITKKSNPPLTVKRAKKNNQGSNNPTIPNNPIHPKKAKTPKINFIHKVWQNSPLPTPKIAV